jgi:hypothetical protein
MAKYLYGGNAAMDIGEAAAEQQAQQSFHHQISVRAEEIDNFLLQADPQHSAQLETTSDPTLAHVIQKHNFSHDSTIRYGRVQMVLPHAHWYRVALGDNGGEIPCVSVSTEGGFRLMGVKSGSTIPPDSQVAVLLHPTCDYGYIMFVLPELNEHGSHSYSDWIGQGSNVGLLRNRYYSEYMRLLSDEGGALNHSCHRPVDSLTFDWTKMAETGLGMHIDPFMFFARVDEECGISGFYNDRLLRIAGHNLDIWTGARWEEDRNDEGENYYFRGETPYPWEMMGCFMPGTDVSEVQTDEDVLHKEPVAKLEPIEDDLQPFVRYQEYGGYLGQARIRSVVLPPASKAGKPEFRRYQDEDVDLGVFREQISADGTYALESAKGVFIAKRSLIPQPKRVRSSADYREDSESAESNNYKFAGQFGGGDEHKVGDLEISEERRNLYSAASILDQLAYVYNWKNLHPFYYHEKDFYLPEETDLELTTNQYLPPFGDLANKTWLDTPAPKEMRVDERYKMVKFWELMQHISLTDDGAIVIQAGQGEEIKLSGGGIQISAPGKIFIQSGNTTAILAGDDFIARAYNSADITATKHDVRIKAEVNTQILAGNSGEGALLLENRATGTTQTYPSEGGETIKGSGIILKAKSSQVAALAQEVYLRSGVGGDGTILLDGNKGNANVRVVAQNIYRFVKGRIRDGFGIPVTEVNVFANGQTLLNGYLSVDGAIYVDGMGVFRQGVVSVNGHISSSSGGEVNRLQNRERFNASLDRIETALEEHKEQHRKDYDSEVDQQFYISERIGNDDTIKKVSFSLRPEEQYGTYQEFVLPQTHWQILNNVVQAGQSWTEEDVEYQTGTQYQPWPGKNAWSIDSNLLTVPSGEFKFYDLEQGTAKDRPYETTEMGQFVRARASSEYKIIPSA